MTDNITTPEDEILLEKEKKFQEKLKMGIHAENVVYPYLKTNNSYVEDLRQQKHGEFAGPRMCGTEGTVTLPDFLVYNKNPAKGSYAVDVKSKTSVYKINGKEYFTVDRKFEEYKKASQIKRLDYLAIIFFHDNRMYMYKETDVSITHQFRPNQYGDGFVYCFEINKSKIIY